MPNKENSAYNEGWEDCLKYYQKDFAPVKDVVESIDKLLDKINKLKVIITHVENHFKNIDINGNEMKVLKDRKKNLECVLELIREQRKNEIECQKKK